MVIPAGRPVYLDLESVGGLIGGTTKAQADYAVIHSFWIPQLAGKQDVVPDRTNHILMQADEPGTYFGQCAEFCGLQHGKMKVARRGALPERLGGVGRQPEAARRHADGSARRQGDGPVLEPALGRPRQRAWRATRSAASTRGVNAAPNLTHFADPNHQCFAGCDWETIDEEALAAWLRDPNAVKLGCEDAQLPPDRRTRSTRWWPTSRA